MNLAGDWLRTNGWNSHHDTVILIHGYGGKDGSFPMVVLRDGECSHITKIIANVVKGRL